MPPLVRAARDEDLPALREIERASGRRYRDFGLDQVADHEPTPIEALSTYAGGGRAWVAVEPDDVPLGFILLDKVDGAAHIEQVSVLPEHQGRGLGRALIAEAAQWATSHGMNALSLTTFGHIPWNRPLYEHLGFRVLSDEEVGPGLRALQQSEAALGLDPTVRVIMRRQLDSRADPSAPDRVQVRLARQADVGPAAELYLRSRHAAVPAIPPLVHQDEDVRRWFGDTVFTEQELWIAEDAAGRVVGLLVLDGDLVEQLYVDPAHTRAGVGSQLLTVAKSLRPDGLHLWTFQSNQNARTFYEKHGFTPVAWTDGAHNEERAADIRYIWEPD